VHVWSGGDSSTSIGLCGVLCHGEVGADFNGPTLAWYVSEMKPSM